MIGSEDGSQSHFAGAVLPTSVRYNETYQIGVGKLSIVCILFTTSLLINFMIFIASGHQIGDQVF